MKTLPEELKILQAQLLQVANATLHAAGELGVKEARSTTLFKHGNDFDEAIQFTANTSLTGEVESGKEYSQWLEYGNADEGPFIYPKTANVLHFFANGEEVFTKYVTAHGPLPFMSNAADIVEQELPNLWNSEVDKIIK